MGALDASVRDFAKRVLRDHRLPNEIVHFPFEIPQAAPWFKDQVGRYLKDLPYIYVSLLRPVSGRGPQFKGEVEGVTYVSPSSGRQRTFYFAVEPQSPELLAKWDLTPAFRRTLGRFVLDVAAADGVPVQLMKTGGSKAALLSKSARNPGVWQMTQFDADAKGPVGHDEAGTPQRLEEMVGEHVANGFDQFSKDAVQRIMSLGGLKGVGDVTEYRGWSIARIEGRQVGYSTDTGKRGKGRQSNGYTLSHPEHYPSGGKFVSTVKEAKEYIDTFMGDERGSSSLAGKGSTFRLTGEIVHVLRRADPRGWLVLDDLALQATYERVVGRVRVRMVAPQTEHSPDEGSVERNRRRAAEAVRRDVEPQLRLTDVEQWTADIYNAFSTLRRNPARLSPAPGSAKPFQQPVGLRLHEAFQLAQSCKRVVIARYHVANSMAEFLVPALEALGFGVYYAARLEDGGGAVESVTVNTANGDRATLDYVNTGDAYSSTIGWDERTGEWWFGSYGAWVEKYERDPEAHQEEPADHDPADDE